MPQKKVPFLQLVETRRGCAMFESTPRYEVVVQGVVKEQIKYNMWGYVGDLPLPWGNSLYVREGSIASFRRQVARINREFAAMPGTATPALGPDAPQVAIETASHSS